MRRNPPASLSPSAMISVAVLSAAVNLFYLTGSFYMLQVYDRVLPSRSVPTLVGLSLLAAGLFALQGLLDLIRGRILVRIGAMANHALHPRVFEAIVRLPLSGRDRGDGQQAVRDLDQVTAFLSSAGPTALFDLPWMPVYIAICYAFHPWIGYTALGGATLLVSLTLLSELKTRTPARAAVSRLMMRNGLVESSRRNAEVLQAMGMAARAAERWSECHAGYVALQQKTSDAAGGLGAISKVLRMLLQSAVLGLGAYLVIDQQATAGVMIAASILTSRALAPVELVIANWKGFVAARQGWKRLKTLLEKVQEREPTMALPRPCRSLAVEAASVAPPEVQRLAVQDASFVLEAGSAVGVIGPSGSGKSSLARLLVGAWSPARGKVRLDGAALEQWDSEALGTHIGYVPQDIEMFAGTIAENIARFAAEPDPQAVIPAARAANVHDLILRLPEGYQTRIGEGGGALSAGQRQRIALARALYGDPFLVVLDEPNSNLDAEGEQALTQAILGIRARGGIAVVIAHRPSALAGCDLVLMMAEGRIQTFGAKDEVLKRVIRHPATDREPAGMPTPVAAVAGGGYGGLRILPNNGEGA